MDSVGLLPRIIREWPYKQSFVYPATWIPIAASATEAKNIQVESDSDFWILAMTATVRDTTNAITLAQWPGTVQVRDGGSGSFWFGDAVNFDSVFGTGQFPFVLPAPRKVPRSGTLAIELKNLEATARNIRVEFHGFKVYGVTPSDDALAKDAAKAAGGQ